MSIRTAAPHALPALLARVRAANGPDRETDVAILSLIKFPEKAYQNFLKCEDCGRFTREQYAQTWAPRYTTSIDAAVALAEHVLPDCWWQVFKQASKKHKVEYAANIIGLPSDPGFGPTLALLAAIISALIAKEQSP